MMEEIMMMMVKSATDPSCPSAPYLSPSAWRWLSREEPPWGEEPHGEVCSQEGDR